jgi:hypothetical protein
MSSGGSTGANKRQLLVWAVADGAAAERRGDWPGAIAAYREAAGLQEELFEAQTTRLFAERLLGSAPDLTSRLAYACVRADRLGDALVAIETGRARMLTSAAMLAGFDLDAIADRSLRERMRRALDLLREYEQIRTDPSWYSPAASGPQIGALHAEVKRLQSEPGASGLTLPAAATLRRLAAGRRVVCLCAGEAGGAALVVPADAGAPLEAVLLPGADLAAVAERTRSIALVGRQLSDDPRAALDGIDACCGWLASAIVEPLLERLPDGAPITFVATSWFSLLPLRAAWTAPPGGSPRHHPLDGVSVSAVPNLRVLDAVRRRPGPGLPAPVLIVADPAGNATHRSLPFARAEAAAIGHQWPVARSLIGPEAIRSVVVGELPRHAVAHFSCHALSDAGQPLNSGILLASGKWLRVHDIMRLPFERGPLVVLSACETAGIGRSAPDEGVGLPAAFLQAGAKGVIASTWPVFDESTSLLMARLYDELEDLPGDTPLALSRAQAWLRAASRRALRDAARGYGMPEPELAAPGPAPYAHPFYWAAFGYTG